MARTAQVLHLAESPNDSFLLKAELAEEGIPCQLLVAVAGRGSGPRGRRTRASICSSSTCRSARRSGGAASTKSSAPGRSCRSSSAGAAPATGRPSRRASSSDAASAACCRCPTRSSAPTASAASSWTVWSATSRPTSSCCAPTSGTSTRRSSGSSSAPPTCSRSSGSACGSSPRIARRWSASICSCARRGRTSGRGRCRRARATWRRSSRR